MTTPTAPHRQPPANQPGPHTVAAETPSLRPLLQFAAIAVPVGWVMLSIPVLTGIEDAPFILATLLFGLVIPSLVITAREHGGVGVRALLRDAIRLPRPIWWLAVAAVALPITVWSAATVAGGAPPVTGAFLTGWVMTLLSSFLIVNLAEETAWTGFAQRRAMARWGTIRGSLVTALLFAGVHLPLAFDRAHNGWDVAEGVTILLLTGVSLRLIIGYLDTWTGRSLLTIGLLHASYNSTADLADTWTRLAITVAFGLMAVAIHRSTSRHPKQVRAGAAKARP